MYLHLHSSVCKLVVMSKRKLLWYEIVRRKLGINLQLFKLLKTSKAFVLMGHFWLNNKLQANGECTLLFPAVRGDITSYCTVNSRHTFQYTAHWIVGAWLCISCRWGKHNLEKERRDNRLNNWLGYSSFRKYLWTYSLRRLLEICVQQWNHAKPKSSSESFTNLYSQPPREVIRFMYEQPLISFRSR